jgi:hypothetical protein
MASLQNDREEAVMTARRTTMGSPKRLVALVATVVMVGATGATAALAAGSQHVSFPVDYTLRSPYYSSFCGFDVMFTLSGTFRSTLIFNSSGAVTSEIDTQPGTTETFSAPSSGKSFSFPFANILRTEYPGGAAPGSPAVAHGAGLAGKVPGLPADAGTVTFDDGTVLQILPGGVPLVDLGPVTGTTGHANDPAAIDAAICAALAG